MSKVTVISCLYDIKRATLGRYSRDFEVYLTYLNNILSLDCNLVLYSDDSRVIDKVSSLNKPNHIIRNKPFSQLEKYASIQEIKNVMSSESYIRGLVEPMAPEYRIPDYSVLINSKIDMMYEEVFANHFGSDVFVWLDSGFRAQLFKQEHIGRRFPSNNINSFDLSKFTILCRSRPQGSDLDIRRFYKSHINRFGAGVLVGGANAIKEIKQKLDIEFDVALKHNLIDSEQSLLAVAYLKNPELFNLYDGDWWSLFDYLIN